MRCFTLILSFFSIVATALPFIEVDYWLVRIFDFPRVQIAVICLAAMILNIVFLKLKRPYALAVFCLLTAALAYQLTLIIKYTPFYPVQAKAGTVEDSDNSFSMMEANIKMGNRKTDEFKQLVYNHNPDLLLVCEPNEWWGKQLAELDKVYPYSLKYPLDNTYGMILYSKLLLKDTEINFIVEEDVPSFFATVVLPSGSEFDLYCLHPKPPKPGTSTYERDTEVLLIGKKVKKRKRPAIVVGDLNDVAWSYTTTLFQQYTGLLDPRQGRGLYNTYNALIPLLRYPLDHIFYSKHFGLLALEKFDNVGSDHFPVFIKLHFDPEMDFSKQNLENDQKVEQEVDEEIER